jgi:LPS-assembly protein
MFSLGHNKVSCVPLSAPTDPSLNPCQGGVAQPGTVLSPPSNQLRAMVGLGQESKRGWNAGFLAIYDYSTNIMQFANTQITYNTDCCAFSGQYRRFNFGTRNENQYRFALVIANIGSFGTLRRQERLF